MLPQASTDRFGDLLKDILQPLNVDASKLEALQRQMNELWQRESVYKSWLQAGSSEPYFPGMRARRGKFDIEPLEFIRVVREESDSPQSVPSGVLTPVTWTKNSGTSQVFEASSGTQINVSTDRARRACLVGTIHWAQDGNGYRSLRAQFRNSSGSVIYERILHRLLPTNLVEDCFPFATSLELQDFPNTESITFATYHSSLGALNLTYLNASLFLVY